ncbi:MAG TPA: ABC transporter permease, partial [Candidatus Nanoarchaeia archaeon]|nr:ABC transporter permease [Candidatus Nanoarchaeia archaeon]
MRSDEVIYSVQSVRKRKLRSVLTILSVLIGIAAIFALLSFGIGIQKYVNTLADESGRDKMFIQSKGIGAPGTDENFQITKDDVDFVTKLNGIDEITGIYFQGGQIEWDKQKKYYFVEGLDPDKIRFIEETFAAKIFKGRQLKNGDLDKAVLGYNYQFDDKVFKKGVKLGDKIKINDNIFEVIGFFDEIGNPADDANVYITDKSFEELYPDKKDSYGFIIASTQPGLKTKD